MNKEEIKIITLGDIFRNLETEEQAFEFLKYIKNLQKENERLKFKIDSWQAYAHELEDYKSRVEKAIEFIKEKARNNCWIDQYEASDLINILQNGSDGK